MFTKGEWKVVFGSTSLMHEKNHASVWSNKDGCGLIASVCDRKQSEHEANAHLIASALKLYAWIKNLGLHMQIGYDDQEQRYWYIDDDYLEERKQILAKAEGREQ